MSIRFKMLSWIVAINVGITGLLLFAIQRNIRAQSDGYQRSAESFSMQREEILQRFENLLVFQKRMSEKELADVSAGVIIGWDEWQLYKDAMVLLNYTELDGEIVHKEILLNPLGKRNRSFDDGMALEILETAITEDRPVLRENGQNPESIYIAVPMHHRSENASGKEAYGRGKRRAWGGALVQPRFPVFQKPMDYFNWPLFWFAMAGGTVVLIMITYAILSRLVIRPVEKLAFAADSMAGGDYSLSFDSTGSGDEIDRLIVSFRYMVSEVRDYHLHLKERVRESQDRAKAAEQHLMIAQRLAATGKLAAGIAHEINNPIGGLINAALNLKKKAGNVVGGKRTQVYLDLIVEGLERIKVIVRKVLEFTPRSLKPADVMLIDVLKDTEALVAHRLGQEGIAFVVKVIPEDLVLFCESGEIRHLFLNLIINAMDAVEEGKGRIEIHGRMSSDGTKVSIEISDNGCGMNEDELSRAFDLFYTTKDEGKGTGLGLSVAHNITVNHGGVIEVNSRVGKGTVVRVLLPAQ